MRNQELHGYLIHHRKYRERSHIVHLFTQEYGRIDGVLRQTPPPQYQPICLQASGKSELKNFSKLEIIHQPVFFFGEAFFAGFYLNEILLRLAALEVEMPQTLLQYARTITQLQHLTHHQSSQHFLKQILRQFEHVFLAELGYAVDFHHDAKQQVIAADKYYIFEVGQGFIVSTFISANSFSGQAIQSMQIYEKGGDFNLEQLQLLSKLYRQILSALLGDRPLKSRQLWIQSIQT